MLSVLIVCFIVFVVLSGLCSGSETGIYRLSKVNLRINAEHGRKLSILLKNMLDDTSSVIFTILIANNLFNYVTTTIATFIFAKYYNGNAEYYAVILTTPLLFVFGEVVPKNIFYRRADTLMTIITLPLWAMHKVLCLTKITPCMKWLESLISKLFGIPLSVRSLSNIRSTINIISDETRHEGLLSPVQWDIMNRMTSISNTTIASVMMPLESVVMVPLDTPKQKLKDILSKHPYTRILLYQGQKQNIKGYLNIYKALNSDEIEISNFVKDIQSLPAQTSVIDAIKIMNRDSLRIVIVEHKSQKLGIITIKDLAEELTGELTVC